MRGGKRGRSVSGVRATRRDSVKSARGTDAFVLEAGRCGKCAPAACAILPCNSAVLMQRRRASKSEPWLVLYARSVGGVSRALLLLGWLNGGMWRVQCSLDARRPRVDTASSSSQTSASARHGTGQARVDRSPLAGISGSGGEKAHRRRYNHGDHHACGGADVERGRPFMRSCGPGGGTSPTLTTGRSCLESDGTDSSSAMVDFRSW